MRSLGSGQTGELDADGRLDASARLLSKQFELQLARTIGLGGIADRLPGAAVPDDHLAGNVLARGDCPSKREYAIG